jgi:hypothetical protein
MQDDYYISGTDDALSKLGLEKNAFGTLSGLAMLGKGAWGAAKNVGSAAMGAAKASPGMQTLKDTGTAVGQTAYQGAGKAMGRAGELLSGSKARSMVGANRMSPMQGANANQGMMGQAAHALQGGAGAELAKSTAAQGAAVGAMGLGANAMFGGKPKPLMPGAPKMANLSQKASSRFMSQMNTTDDVFRKGLNKAKGEGTMSAQAAKNQGKPSSLKKLFGKDDHKKDVADRTKRIRHARHGANTTADEGIGANALAAYKA